jgi:hypothetical protein
VIPRRARIGVSESFGRPNMIDRLDIALLHRPGEKGSGMAFKTERYSVDFIVNGASLFEATKASDRDMCGCFFAADTTDRIKAMNQAVAKQFTLEVPTEIRAASGAIEGHRVALFVCPECADLGCGAITLEITRDGDTVRWSHFAYQNDWQFANGETWDDFDSFGSIGPFEFDWESYKIVIQHAAKA